MTGKHSINRRAILATGAAALALPAFPARAFMPNEAADTPKICLGPIVDSELKPRGIQRFHQIRITHIILNNYGFPWKEE